MRECALRRQRAEHAGRHGADAGERGGAEQEAEREEREAPAAAAEVAKGEAPGEAQHRPIFLVTPALSRGPASFLRAGKWKRDPGSSPE